MKRKTIMLSAAAALALGMNAAHAFNFGNMMNPGKWFDDDDHDRYYGRYGGYGYGPYGWGGPYGYGGGPYGWGGPYGGWGPYGGHPSTIVVNPSSGDSKPAPKAPE
ncbi:MAG: hypothetical protein R3F42_09190 [Pseudomonadota bacterium]